MIRAAMEAWNRGDWDEALKDAAPGFELDNSSSAGEWRGVASGPDQAKRMWETFVEPWESVRIEVSEFIEADDGVVVTRQKARFVGRDGIEPPGPTRSGWLWRSVTASSRSSPSTLTSTTPSKPPGCRSRRCRRRTWTSCVGATRPSTGANMTRRWRFVTPKSSSSHRVTSPLSRCREVSRLDGT